MMMMSSKTSHMRIIYMYVLLHIVVCIGIGLIMKILVDDGRQLSHEMEDIIIGGFFVFVCVMILLHCHLKRQQTRQYKRDVKCLIYRFEWESRGNDDD